MTEERKIFCFTLVMTAISLWLFGAAAWKVSDYRAEIAGIKAEMTQEMKASLTQMEKRTLRLESGLTEHRHKLFTGEVVF